MFLIECDPRVNRPYLFRHNTEEEANEAAKALAEKYRTNVTVLKEIRVFRIRVIEEEINT